MQRLWILALLACGPIVLPGCGGEKKETADNSSSSSSSSDSGSSGRPKRNGNGNSQNSAPEMGGSGGGSSSSGSPSMSNDPRMNGGNSSSGNSSPGSSGSAKSPSSGSGKSRADEIWANETGPVAPEGFGGPPGASGSPGGSGGSPQMSNDPRMNGGGAGGSGGGSSAPQMGSNDPRMNGGGAGGSGGGSGAPQMGSNDPRMNGGGAGGSGGGSSAPQMSGDPRSNGGGGAGSMRGGAGSMRGGAGSMRGGGANRGGGSSGFGGSGFGGSNNQPSTPETLKEKSLAAFKSGDDDGGFQYMYGHYVAEDAGRSSIPIQFLPKAKRPRLAIRWGVGVVYKTNRGFEGAPPKIGEKPNVLPQPRGSRNRGGLGGAGGAGGGSLGGFGSGGAGGFGGNSGGSPAKGGMDEFKYYTGEVGDQLLESIDKLRVRGNFGKMIAKVDSNISFASTGRAGGAGGAGGGARGGFGGPGGAGGSPGGSPGSLGSGGVADDFASGGSIPGRPGGGGNRAPRAKSSSDYKNLLPGVLMLGEGSLKSLSAKARARGIDVLVVFDVNCKLVPSTGQKINDTKISFYDVSGDSAERVGKPSSTLNNVRVWLAREKNKDEERDPVINAVKKMFESGVENGFMATYKIAKMPTLNEGQAIGRLTTLVTEGQASGNPMPALVELTYYREKGLVGEKAYVDSVNKLTGAEIGDTLLNGSEEEKVKALSNLLPPEWKVNEAAGGEDAEEDIL